MVLEGLERESPAVGFGSLNRKASYLRAGGKSVQLPCATSTAMPMLSPSVGAHLNKFKHMLDFLKEESREFQPVHQLRG